jgi:putative SbcD/Mre11-related phosphoesterase|tara:strand:- start:51 stop:923 length:873 start_codon:yes stop_codon:yes gene_type:complete
MKILNNIEMIDLALYINKTLIVTDFHIGYEEALNKQGVLMPRFQFEEIIKRLEKIFLKLKNKKIDQIIINGDLKHEFGSISDQEWRLTLRLLDFLGKHCKEIILIKGNHDNILGPIARKRNVKVLDHYIIKSSIKKNSIKGKSIFKKTLNKKSLKKLSLNKKALKIINNKKDSLMKNLKLNKKNNILVLHGDKIPSKELLKDVSTIIIGHEHPAVSIKEGPRVELVKCFLVGKWKRHNLIVLPSFNLVTEGTDVLKEQILSPFLRNNLRNLNVYVVADKVYGFGKLKDLN